MKNSHIKTAIITLILVIIQQLGFSQGFLNLNFEQGYSTSNTIPNWIAYINGTPISSVGFNNPSLSGDGVGLISLNPLQGNYYVFLQGSGPFISPGSAALGQTGTIPLSAQSLIFWGNVGANDVSFAGQTLPLTVLSSTANYDIYGANISAFAGQIGQLLFTSFASQSGGQWDSIDNIQFSSSPIPEPGTLALGALGATLLAFRRRRNSAP